MRKSIVTLLLCAFLLLCGCQDVGAPQSAESQPPKEEPSQSVTTEAGAHNHTPQAPSTASPFPSRSEDTAYLDIPLVPSKAFSVHLFGKSEDNRFLKMNLPSQWEFSQASEHEFVIQREGKQIGTVSSQKAADSAEWTPVSIKKNTVLGIEVEAYVEKSGTGDTLAFRQRFYYQYRTDTKRTITLTLDYAEVDEKAKTNLMNDLAFHTVSVNPNLGVLSNAKKERILILGNSFVGSSHVGDILREMMQKNGKDCTVTAIARGMASVGTYTGDPYMMNEIKNGSYDVVFICGFYSASEISHLYTLKSACDASGTKLALFPAHNEDANVVDTAASVSSDIPLINWKKDIELLIVNGVNIWDLCIDDYFLHSTPLAGYVGAHAIYRAMYGTPPTQPLSSSIDQSYVNEKLGEYVHTGLISYFPIESLHFFN